FSPPESTNRPYATPTPRRARAMRQTAEQRHYHEALLAGVRPVLGMARCRAVRQQRSAVSAPSDVAGTRTPLRRLLPSISRRTVWKFSLSLLSSEPFFRPPPER